MQEYVTVNEALTLGFLVYFTQNLWCCWIGFRKVRQTHLGRVITLILVCLISTLPWVVTYLMGRDDDDTG